MAVPTDHLRGGRDATQDYPESGAEIQIFVYGAVRWVEAGQVPALEIDVHPRVGSRGRCSGGVASGPVTIACRHAGLSLCRCGPEGLPGVCAATSGLPACGVKVERMPWARGKCPLTESYAWFLASWAKRLSWQEVAAAFHMSWDSVFLAVERAVTWGLAHRDLSAVESIGIDEIAWQRGHRYLTLVYQIDSHCKRLLWIGEKRTVKTLLHFFRWFGPERSLSLRFVCSDMWKPYLKVIARKAANATHVLDRFHIIAIWARPLTKSAPRGAGTQATARNRCDQDALAAAEAPGAAEREADQPSVGAVAT